MAGRRCNVPGLAHPARNGDLAGRDHVTRQAGRANVKNDRIAQWLIAFATEPEPHIRQGHAAGSSSRLSRDAMAALINRLVNPPLLRATSVTDAGWQLCEATSRRTRG